MVAGSVGMKCSSSGEELAEGKKGLDTVAAQTGWWMFETKITKSAAAKKITQEEKGRSGGCKSIISKPTWRNPGDEEQAGEGGT